MKKYIILTIIFLFFIILFFAITAIKQKRDFAYLMEKIEEEVVLSESVIRGTKKLEVSNLKPIQIFVSIPEINKKILLYREFEEKGEKLFLGADLETLKTYIFRQEDISYFEDYTSNANTTRLYNIMHNQNTIKNFNIDGYILMIELAGKEAKKYSFEKELFLFLASKNKNIPISVIVTSRWIIEDRVNFNLIDSLVEQKKLDVTWLIKISNSNNLESEVLNTERLILESGQIPSIFFKVDGAYKGIQENLKALSLIPIDSNTILGKGEKIKKGGMVLIKGDGSERKYVKEIKDEVDKKKGLQIGSLYDIK